MANCDVFISYRRTKGRDIARCLQLALTARGVNCFFDLHDVRKGLFNEKIKSAIEGAGYFVLLLTKDCLENCRNPDDWVRIEIEHALEKKIPIIPVVPSGHPKRFSRKPLPKSIAKITKIEISELSLEKNFEYDVDHLLEERLEKLVQRKNEKGVQEREQVFLSAAQRYKWNDGKIDDGERTQLESLATELSIGAIRREALIEQVEMQYEMARRAAAVFLSAARRHKNDDGVIDDEERAELDRLAERLSLDKVKREELIQHVEMEYEGLLQYSPSLLHPSSGTGMDKDVSFNSSKGEFEFSDGTSARVVVESEPEEARHTKISDVLAARFEALPQDAGLFVSDIPLKKRTTAWRTMNVRESEESIRLLGGATLSGSAAEGLIVTNEAVYFKNLTEDPVRVRLDKVDRVAFLKGGKISIGGRCCECGFLADKTKRALCKALDGLGAELAQRGVAFGDDTSAVDAVLGCFAGVGNNSDVYVGDGIPDKLRMNAHRALCVKEPLSDICLLADATVFGSAEEGRLVVTPKAVYFKNSFESPSRIPLDEIQRVKVVKKDLVLNGMKFSSVGADLAQAAPLLAKGIRTLAKKFRKLVGV